MGFPVVFSPRVERRRASSRTTPLGGFADGEGAWLVAATLGGAARHPAWFLNMAKHPDEIWLEVGSERFKVRGESLEGQERVDALARIAKVSPRYGNYQEKTDREIPIVRLTRRGPYGRFGSRPIRSGNVSSAGSAALGQHDNPNRPVVHVAVAPRHQYRHGCNDRLRTASRHAVQIPRQDVGLADLGQRRQPPSRITVHRSSSGCPNNDAGKVASILPRRVPIAFVSDRDRQTQPAYRGAEPDHPVRIMHRVMRISDDFG